MNQSMDVQQLVKTTQTKIKVRKSTLIKQDQDPKYRQFISDFSKEDAKLAEQFFMRNMSAIHTSDDMTDATKMQQISAEIKLKNRHVHHSEERPSSQHSCSGGASKSILRQIREREKEAAIKHVNKSVKETIMDLEKLAVNDSEMIELQRKTIYVQQLEIEELKRKTKVIQRNMAATANTSKNMQDEICLVKEDRVVLELHNRQIEQAKEEVESKLRQEIIMLRMTNMQNQLFIQKLTTEHTRERKDNKRFIKNMLSKHHQTTVTRGCQTDEANVRDYLPSTIGAEPEKALLSQLNRIYSQGSNRKALLPLNANEDELIIASRMARRKSSQKNEQEDEDVIIRDTDRLSSREGTHANVAIQAAGPKAQNFKYLFDHLKTKNEHLARKEKQINQLQDRLKEARQQLNIAGEIENKLKAEHSQVLSMVIKEKDNQQRRVVSQFRSQRDLFYRLKEEAYAELDAYRNEIGQTKEQQKGGFRVIVSSTSAAKEGNLSPHPNNLPRSRSSFNFKRDSQQAQKVNEIVKIPMVQSEDAIISPTILDVKPMKETPAFQAQPKLDLRGAKDALLTPNFTSGFDALKIGAHGQSTSNLTKSSHEEAAQLIRQRIPLKGIQTSLSKRQPATLGSTKKIVGSTIAQVNSIGAGTSSDVFDGWTNNMVSQTELIARRDQNTMATGPDEFADERQVLSEHLTMIRDVQEKPTADIPSTLQGGSEAHRTADDRPVVSDSNHQSMVNSNKPVSQQKSKSTRKTLKAATPTNEHSTEYNADIRHHLTPSKQTDFEYVETPPSNPSSNKKSPFRRKPKPVSSPTQSMGRRSPKKTISSDAVPYDYAGGRIPPGHTKKIEELEQQVQAFEILKVDYQNALQQQIDLQRQLSVINEMNQTLRWQLRNSEEKLEESDHVFRQKVEEFEKEKQNLVYLGQINAARIEIDRTKYSELMVRYLASEQNYRDSQSYSEEIERTSKSELAIEKRISTERLIEIDNLKSKMFIIEESQNEIVQKSRLEIITLKQSFLDLKGLFQRKLDTEKSTLEDKLNFLARQIAKLHVHISCLGCDQIRTDSLMLLCGHNICDRCLQRYSKTDHPRSSVRCEVCCIETKVAHLAISLPNRAICEDMTEIKERVDHLLNYDIIGETIINEVYKKQDFGRINENVI